MSKTISMADLSRDIKRELASVSWDEKYRPDELEAQGVPAETELRGFREDARGILDGRIAQRFSGQSSVDRTELGDLLTEIAYEQGRHSAGPFVRYFSLELRDRVLCRDYLKDKASAEFSSTVEQKQDASLLIGKVVEHLGDMEPEHDEVIGMLHNKMHGYGTVDTQEFVDAAQEIVDGYEGDKWDDGYMEGYARDIAEAAKAVTSVGEAVIDARVAEMQMQEQGWGQPISVPEAVV